MCTVTLQYDAVLIEVKLDNCTGVRADTGALLRLYTLLHVATDLDSYVANLWLINNSIDRHREYLSGLMRELTSGPAKLSTIISGEGARHTIPNRVSTSDYVLRRVRIKGFSVFLFLQACV